ncbi:phosphopantetheine-binding protein, partial [Streptomyces sp. NPDC052052]|uniref:phosphopantetheine-binding protein n=1 Tax=Streptomyces sp. NPDC052052 TaxID=3154756 RepID=UPI003425D003
MSGHNFAVQAPGRADQDVPTYERASLTHEMPAARQDLTTATTHDPATPAQVAAAALHGVLAAHDRAGTALFLPGDDRTLAPDVRPVTPGSPLSTLLELDPVAPLPEDVRTLPVPGVALLLTEDEQSFAPGAGALDAADVVVHLDLTAEPATATWVYDADSYTEPVIAAHARSFELLLTGLADRLPGTVEDVRRPSGPQLVRLAPARSARRTESDTERLLAEIWSGFLGFDEIGPDDDFFALGGDSTNATRMMARITEQWGVRVHPDDFYTESTLAALAATVDRLTTGSGHTADLSLPQISAGSGGGVVSFGQERLWFLDELSGGGALYNVPF